MTPTQYEELKKRIQELVPEKCIRCESNLCSMHGNTPKIRLADILICLPDGYGIESRGIFLYNDDLLLKEWDLFHDNIDDQSDETKQFLYDILISKKKV